MGFRPEIPRKRDRSPKGEIEMQHRLTWRGFTAFHITADTREEAIRIAIADQPKYIPAGTELYYGVVSSVPVYIAEDEDPRILIESA